MRDSAHNSGITWLGRTNFRNQHRLFGIKRADRRAHLYLIGKTGTGKSTLLYNLIRQDIASGEGLALLDPHGDLIEDVLRVAEQERRNDLIYFNVPDTTRPLGFNPLENVPPLERPLAASGVLEVFKKLWPDSWGPRTEHLLRNAILALLDLPMATLADILRLFDDRVYRQQVGAYISNPQVRAFWLREYEGYAPRFRSEAIAPIQNKVGAFLADPRLRAIVTQTKSSFDLRDVMDQGKILLINLAKGRIGQDTASLLGALIVARIGIAGLSRANIPEPDRRDFYIYVDEFQTFATLHLAGMLSELRKYRVNLVLAHQFLSQLDLQVRDAIVGNVGTIITFRVGLTDAEILEKEFYPEFRAMDLLNLPNYAIYLKLMLDGVVSRPFSADTLGSE